LDGTSNIGRDLIHLGVWIEEFEVRSANVHFIVYGPSDCRWEDCKSAQIIVGWLQEEEGGSLAVLHYSTKGAN
jgi:hypothetical protein